MRFKDWNQSRLSTALIFLIELLASCCGSNVWAKNVHKSLKKRDLSRIFGVDHHSEVPPYEITYPVIHDDEQSSHLISELVRRRRRSTLEKKVPSKDLRMELTAFEKRFHLNMSLNENLLGPNFQVEVVRHNRTTVRRDVQPCHYIGHILGHEQSTAAVSTCGGLSGMFMTSEHDFFVEPVPDYINDGGSSSQESRPHIVYRRDVSSKNNAVVEKKPSLLEAFWDVWDKNFARVSRSCGALKNDRIRLERSSGDDLSSLVKADNTERYIECLVVIDQKMVNYHGEDAASQFALVVLNIAASLFRDGSIGSNLINIVVVKLQLLTVDPPGLVINHHARNTLENFGSWAARQSDQDDRSDDHYDYAILLTRFNICADKSEPCDTLGLTQVGGMCEWPNSVSINKDNGLPLSFTIAHSLGHSLGMNHDGDESSFVCPDNTYMMSSESTKEWRPTRYLWSRCSRNYLHQFLRKPQANCLLDLPVKSQTVDYEKMDNKPGILYDVNKQCEMQFGTGSKICNKDKQDEVCKVLTCTNPSNPDKCFTSSYPAADGTICGLNKWCYRGKCMESGQTNAVDGGWSNWSDEYSPCSRTCGGGTQYRQRICNHPKPSNGGKHCEGNSRVYRLCSAKPCPEGGPSHRNQQCSNLNSRLFGEKLFEWEFKPSRIDPCKLGCFIAGTQHGYDFGNVIDGTNCDQLDDSVISDKCINGECVTVGCDAVLGSKAKFDRCGVCNGDGSSCQTGQERSDIPETTTGGIAEALKSLRDMGFDMQSLYGKSQLSLNEKRSGVARKGNDSSADFGWARVKSGCSVSCGGGIETITAECRRQDDGSPAPEGKCDASLMPPTQQYPCKEDVCPPVWQTSYWGDCSKTCNSGVKRRNVRCVQKSSTGIEYDVDESLCNGIRPSDAEACNKEPCPPEWIGQPYGECSTICGAGIQVRDVLCQRTLRDNTLETLKEGECRKENKPPTEQKCNVHNPCPGDAGCGGIYTDPHGNFTTPNFPNNYPNNMECVHIIQVQEKKVIRLEFEAMRIVAPDDKDCKNDFVKVMDGDCVSRLGESKFCGNSLPPPFISTTNRLCLKFYSDDSQNDEGFSARYDAIDKPSQPTDFCDANITSPAGLLSSPNYPEYYPSNEDCNMTIITEDKPIRITFHAFDVGSDDCSNDFVFLSGGAENKKYCGQKIPPVYTSTKNMVLLRFVSTSHAASTKPGFVATYTSGSAPETTRAPDITTTTEKSTTKETPIPNKEEPGSYLTSEHPVRLANSSGAFIEEDKDDVVKKDVVPSAPNQHPGVSFVNIKPSAGDEIAKSIQSTPAKKTVEALKPVEDLSEKARAFANAMKDDTPGWIPEPADTFESQAMSEGPSDHTQSPARLVQKSGVPVSEKTTSQPLNKAGTANSRVFANRTDQIISKAVIPSPVRPGKSGKASVDLRSTIPRNALRATNRYEHNLDGKRGDCPRTSDLKCIRVLLSYPCRKDSDCRAGFSCCPTSCLYGNRMCTPKVTRHCPLRDPFYFPHIPCKQERDCPMGSPCCLDMANRQYCRHGLTDRLGS